MNFEIRTIFCRSATIELNTDECWASPAGLRVSLNGDTVDTGGRNVFSLHGLKPNTEYSVAVEAEQGVVEHTFTTKAETALLNVRAFGAKGDGETDDTAALEAAVLACPQGGTVEVPAGDYRTGPLFLKSSISLWLEKGARLLGQTSRERYPILPGVIRAEEGDEYNLGTWEGNPLDCYAALLTGVDVENVDIFGEGTVDGDAQHGDWWDNCKVRRGAWRPNLVYLVRCKNISVQGITLRNSYCWTLHPYYSSEIRLLDLTVENDPDSPNTDAIDPESCTDVLILGCRMTVGDDCIAIKSGKRYMACYHRQPSKNIVIRNCLMERGHGAVVIGSEVSGGVYDVEVSQCVFSGTDRGLRIKTRRGRGSASVLDGIRLNRIRMENVLMPFTLNMFYFCDPDGHSDYVQNPEMMPVDERTPRIGSITIENAECFGATAAGAFFYGLPEQPVEEITMRNVSISFAKDAAPEVPIMMDNLEDTERLGVWATNVRCLTLYDVSTENAKGKWPVVERVPRLHMKGINNG